MLFELAAVQNPQLTSYQERACQELFYVTVVIRGSSEEVYVLKCIVPECTQKILYVCLTLMS